MENFSRKALAGMVVNGGRITLCLQEKLKDLTDAGKDNPLALHVSSKTTDRVVRKYPDSTYAKTFEFRVTFKDELKKLSTSFLNK